MFKKTRSEYQILQLRSFEVEHELSLISINYSIKTFIRTRNNLCYKGITPLDRVFKNPINRTEKYYGF